MRIGLIGPGRIGPFQAELVITAAQPAVTERIARTDGAVPARTGGPGTVADPVEAAWIAEALSQHEHRPVRLDELRSGS